MFENFLIKDMITQLLMESYIKIIKLIFFNYFLAYHVNYQNKL